MPAQRKDHRQDRDQHGDRRKEYADLCGLARRDHIGGKVLKDLLELSGARGNVILAARHICHLPQGLFIDLPAEPAAASATKATSPSAKWGAETSPEPKRIIVTTIHR